MRTAYPEPPMLVIFDDGLTPHKRYHQVQDLRFRATAEKACYEGFDRAGLKVTVELDVGEMFKAFEAWRQAKVPADAAPPKRQKSGSGWAEEFTAAPSTPPVRCTCEQPNVEAMSCLTCGGSAS